MIMTVFLEYLGASVLPLFFAMIPLRRGKLSEIKVLTSVITSCFVVSMLVAFGSADLGVDGNPLNRDWIIRGLIDGIICCVYVYIPVRLMCAKRLKKTAKQTCAEPQIE
jgi:hypothetical protein